MSERDRRRAELLNDSEATLRRVKSLLTDLEVDEGESPDGAADGSPASEAPTPQEGAEAAGGGLIDLVRTVFSVSDQIAEIVDSLQESKELLDRVAADRVRRTQAKLEEVSSATESAATSMLDGLDRALALVDEIEAVEEGKDEERRRDLRDRLRDELHTLINLLQFQDITNQQLGHASEVLLEIEARLQEVLHTFQRWGIRHGVAPAGSREASLTGAPLPSPGEGEGSEPEPQIHDPNATTDGSENRQSVVDEIFP